MSYVMAGVQVFSSLAGGVDAKGRADLQAQQLTYQGQLAEAEALQTAKIIRKAGRRQVGASNAAYSGVGVKVGEGSAAVLEAETITGVEHDAFQAILEGKRKGLGMQTQAGILRVDGKAAQAASIANGMTSALGSYYQGQRASGWRTKGPGYSGTQAPAPVEWR
jgi:hypothetical protein